MKNQTKGRYIMKKKGIEYYNNKKINLYILR